nr:expressed protein [Hymenolepis microstoma]
MSSYIKEDPRRSNKIHRYRPPEMIGDAYIELVNLFGLVMTIGGLWLHSKFCAWIAVFCTLLTITNSRSSDDIKQLITMTLFAASVLVMSYYQNPTPLALM